MKNPENEVINLPFEIPIVLFRVFDIFASTKKIKNEAVTFYNFTQFNNDKFSVHAKRRFFFMARRS